MRRGGLGTRCPAAPPAGAWQLLQACSEGLKYKEKLYMSYTRPASPLHSPSPFQSYAALSREQPFAAARSRILTGQFPTAQTTREAELLAAFGQGLSSFKLI